MTTYHPKTQKAISVKVLADNFYQVPNHRIQSAHTPIEEKYLPSFVRPCPIKARHGFVGSEYCTSVEQAERVRLKTLEADSQGEIILMSKVDARLSAVLTPNAIAIGKGNDGATAGKNSLYIPLASVHIDKSMRAQAGVTECPYIEVLYETPYSMKFVQLRNGVSNNDIGDFSEAWICKDMTIEKILMSSDYSDMEFEAIAVEYANTNTVVSHIGGSMSSHHSQHSRKANLPVFYKTTPYVGDKIKKNFFPPPSKFARVIDGLKAETILNQSEQGSMELLLTAVHQSSIMIGDNNGAFLVGLAVRKILSLAYSACIGEARHANKKKLSRESIYSKVLKVGTSASRKRLLNARKLFYTHKWPAGYGGLNWAQCSEVTLKLEHALGLFTKKPNEKNLQEVLSAVHSVINTAHNNGAFLNKFCQTSLFDSASVGDIKVTCKAMFKAFLLIEYANEIPITKDENFGLQSLKFQTYRKFVASKLTHYDNATKKIVLGQDATLQFKIVPEIGSLHFQVGAMGNYKSFNVELIDSEKRSFMIGNEGYLTIQKSLSNSDTKYYVISKDFPVSSIPQKIKDALKIYAQYEVK